MALIRSSAYLTTMLVAAGCATSSSSSTTSTAMAVGAEATPAGYREKGRFQIKDQGLPSWAHPVVTGGRLYLREQDTLLCYDVKQP